MSGYSCPEHRTLARKAEPWGWGWKWSGKGHITWIHKTGIPYFSGATPSSSKRWLLVEKKLHSLAFAKERLKS